MDSRKRKQVLEGVPTHDGAICVHEQECTRYKPFT